MRRAGSPRRSRGAAPFRAQFHDAGAVLLSSCQLVSQAAPVDAAAPHRLRDQRQASSTMATAGRPARRVGLELEPGAGPVKADGSRSTPSQQQRRAQTAAATGAARPARSRPGPPQRIHSWPMTVSRARVGSRSADPHARPRITMNSPNPAAVAMVSTMMAPAHAGAAASSRAGRRRCGRRRRLPGWPRSPRRGRRGWYPDRRQGHLQRLAVRPGRRFSSGMTMKAVGQLARYSSRSTTRTVNGPVRTASPAGPRPRNVAAPAASTGTGISGTVRPGPGADRGGWEGPGTDAHYQAA